MTMKPAMPIFPLAGGRFSRIFMAVRTRIPFDLRFGQGSEKALAGVEGDGGRHHPEGMGPVLDVMTSWHSRRTWTTRRLLPVLVGTALVAALLPVTGVVAARAQVSPRTAITLTFDDGWDTQWLAHQALASRGMPGTFYINSGLVGSPGYLTRAQVDAMAAAGHEIGGHTVSHQNLLDLPPDEANRQICNDRTTLLGWGFRITSFAYPFADFNASTKSIAASCGYNSARAVGDLRSPDSCGDCPAVETRPPADAYEVRTADEVDPTWSLADLQQVVTQAEVTGGWTTLVFHQICDGCTSSAISESLFTQFLTWLQPRTQLGTQVRTVDQVVGGPLQPAVPGTAPPAPGGPGVNTVQNPSLETASTTGGPYPECWTLAGYGTNTVQYAAVSPGRTGGVAGRLTMSAHTSGDAKLLQPFDLGRCTPSVTPGRTYTASAWYTSSVSVFLTLYRRNGVGSWSYWTQSPRFAAAANWQEARWTTPAVPADTTGVAFGVTIDGVGQVTTDDYSLVDSPSAPPPAPPGVNGLTNPSLETLGGDGFPHCWTGAGYGDNDPAWTRVTDASHGGFGQRLDITGHVSGDAKLIQPFDTGNCSPSVTAGHPYTFAADYHSTQPVFFTVYRRAADGTWSYWTQSPTFPASATYARATWQSPAVPAGVTALSFGLTLDSNGSLTTDNYSLVDSS
jgi:peptidoglycan/xylan/chitin deacetylase (PgdA/CDA1 family)